LNSRALAAIFFDLDGTLCAPTVPFREVFGGRLADLLAARASCCLAVGGPATWSGNQQSGRTPLAPRRGKVYATASVGYAV